MATSTPRWPDLTVGQDARTAVSAVEPARAAPGKAVAAAVVTSVAVMPAARAVARSTDAARLLRGLSAVVSMVLVPFLI
ncbi:hypothetical protein [Streptomyces olivaceoviridis]|uniref:hypothetical protein n=1 Tax=Streptomyces olivaceoviridis TaxID=1921 RepID=UPI00332B3FDC